MSSDALSGFTAWPRRRQGRKAWGSESPGRHVSQDNLDGSRIHHFWHHPLGDGRLGCGPRLDPNSGTIRRLARLEGLGERGHVRSVGILRGSIRRLGQAEGAKSIGRDDHLGGRVLVGGACRLRRCGHDLARFRALVPFGQVVGVDADLLEPLERPPLRLHVGHVVFDPLDLDGAGQQLRAILLKRGNAGSLGLLFRLIEHGALQVEDDPLRLIAGSRELVFPRSEHGREPSPSRVGITLGHSPASPLNLPPHLRFPHEPPVPDTFLIIPELGRPVNEEDLTRIRGAGACRRAGSRGLSAARGPSGGRQP